MKYSRLNFSSKLCHSATTKELFGLHSATRESPWHGTSSILSRSLLEALLVHPKSTILLLHCPLPPRSGMVRLIWLWICLVWLRSFNHTSTPTDLVGTCSVWGVYCATPYASSMLPLSPTAPTIASPRACSIYRTAPLGFPCRLTYFLVLSSGSVSWILRVPLPLVRTSTEMVCALSSPYTSCGKPKE